jgi:polyhydroxyalkanoate synthesis regulator protein
VIDTQTGEDISKLILIQVVLESEKNKEDILPASFLHMLIKYGNKIARDFIENSFLMMFQPYLSFQDSLKKNMRLWKDTGLMPPGLEMPFPSEGQDVMPGGKYDYEPASPP